MKRVISILCALALTVSCLAVTAFAADNKATGATVFVDAIHNEWASAPSTMLDGNYSTRWQSANAVDGEGGSFFGIAWSEPQSFNTVTTYWEASAPAKDQSKLYVAYAAASLTEIDQSRFQETCYTDNGTVWTEVTNANLSRADAPKDGVQCSDTWTTEDNLTGVYAIKIVPIGKNDDSNANMSCFEIEVYDFTAGTPYDLTKVNAAKSYVDKAFGTSNTYGYSDASWSAYTTAYAAVTSAITACDAKMVGEVSSIADQNALDMLADDLLAAAAKLTGNGTAATNLLENGIMIYDTANMQSYAAGNNLRTLTDGLFANNNNSWQPKGTVGEYVYLKLNNASDMNEIVLYAESAVEEYSIAYTTAAVSTIATVAGMDELTWTDTAATREYSVDLGNDTAYQFYTFDTVEDVTAIKVTCTVANGGYCKLREVEAFNDGENTYKGTTQFTNGSDVFVATSVAEHDVSTALSAYYTITKADSTVATGTVALTNAYAMIKLGDTTITAADVDNAHAGDYVTGVLFTNVEEGTSIQISWEAALE